MSKICCGVTYADEDKFCAMCGKLLVDNNEVCGNQEDEVNNSDVIENDFNNSTNVLTSNDNTESNDIYESANTETPKELVNNDKVEETKFDDDEGATTVLTQSDMMPNQMVPPMPNQIAQPMPNQMVPPMPNQMAQQKPNKKEKKAKKENSGSKGLKICSIITMILAIIGLLAVLAGTYFFYLNPSYKDSKGAAKDYNQEQVIDVDAEEGL